MLTKQQIDEITEAYNATRRGVWTTINGRLYCDGMEMNPVQGGFSNDDMYFIARAHQDVPALLAEVTRLKEVIKRKEEDIQFLKKHRQR